MEYSYSEAPEPGAIHERYGNRYELLAATPYTRKSDGAPSAVLTWLGSCAQCGQPFTVQAGLTAKNLNRRCDEHRKAFTPATREARNAKRVGGRKGAKIAYANRKALKELLG